MRLYKMELYKICHRKIFLIGILCMIGILIFYFYGLICEEECFVDGVSYKGYEAIQVNRQITEEFKGIFTDEKAQQIIEKYGFPKEVQEFHTQFIDANFLTNFVTEYLSDGYFYGWNDYKAPTRLYAIADTELGKAKEITGQEIVLKYNNGWHIFLDFLQFGGLLGSILILFGISVVFAMEGQTKMIQILFTTKEGKKNDIYAKIAAAFTVSAAVWAGVVILDLLLCGSVYGLDGLDNFIGMTKIFRYISSRHKITMLNVGVFVLIVMFRSMLSVLMLCSTTICISSCVKKSFHALLYSALCFGMPVMLWMLLSNIHGLVVSLIYLYIYASPLYLSMCDTLRDIYEIWTVIAGVSIVISVLCAIFSYRNYKRQQAV